MPTKINYNGHELETTEFVSDRVYTPGYVVIDSMGTKYDLTDRPYNLFQHLFANAKQRLQKDKIFDTEYIRRVLRDATDGWFIIPEDYQPNDR